MQSSSRTKLTGFAIMFLSSSLMGGIGAFARYIEAPGLFISFARNLAGLVLMTLIFTVGRKYVRFRGFRLTPALVASGVFLGLLSGLYVMSTQMTTLANAAFLIYTGPIYSTILASIFLKEPFTRATAISLSSVFVGCLLIIGIINYSAGAGFTVSLDLDPKYFAGNMVALASGVAYGLFLFVSRYRTDVESDVRAYTNFTFAVITLAVINVVKVPDLGGMTARGWLVLAVAAFVTGAGAFYFLTVASKILLAGELATISYQETIMATILGVALFSEPLSLMQILGGVLIIVGGLSQILFSTKKAPELTEAFTQGGVAGGRHDDGAATTVGSDPDAPGVVRPELVVPNNVGAETK
ncbi:DMT family transporter [Georgenia muralis]|uniref:EamA domain-containing membrane protein RarD n=1 Tax=Georgenia muralis TaxID=154117 RepID=A0A3N5A5M8_9MICO|nr:DMT family transporter [Georgenia muralis]RPF27061.1 EamA domain-containing membrane protein RarD [Georgenia muralis]